MKINNEFKDIIETVLQKIFEDNNKERTIIFMKVKIIYKEFVLTVRMQISQKISSKVTPPLPLMTI